MYGFHLFISTRFDTDAEQPALNFSTLSLIKGIVIIFSYLFRNECKDSVDYKTIVKKVKSRNDFPRRNRRSAAGNTGGVWLSTATGAATQDDEFEYNLQFLCLNPAVAFVDMAKSE